MTPVTTVPIPPAVVVRYWTTVDARPDILEPSVASFGNSRAITSPNVPAPPLHRVNPSTAFEIIPVRPDTPPLKFLRMDNNGLNAPATPFAAFSPTIAVTILAIALPTASIVAGS